MSEPDPIMDLLRYYTTGQVDPILLRKANAILGRCKPEVRTAAIDWITDNIPRQDGKYRHELSVTDMRNALREVGQPSDEYIPAVEWTCDLCSMKFQYVQITTYELKHDKGLFDYCPRCGLQPADTIRAQAEAELARGSIRPWYAKWKDVVNRDWESREGAWIFDKAIDDAFTANARREFVETMKREASEAIARLARERKA